MYLMDKERNTVIPLLSARFQVDISEGYADMVLHQVYENVNDYPLETLFMLPLSESLTLNKIQVDFILPDGQTKSLETKVSEREKAEIKYNDAVASGKTAVISTITRPTST